MLHRIFRLTDIKYIETITEDLEYGQDIVIVRPTYLSICAADQRYFFGKRKKAIMQKKLPLALIHEAVGVVVQDKSGTLARGTRVAMVPNISPAEHTIVKDNYSRDSKFCSSSADGFMQDLVAVPGDRLIPLPEGMDEKAFVFTEPLSVAFNAVEAFQRVAVTPKTALGIWGDGSIGFLLALVLRHMYPDSKIYVFGHNRKKLQRFS